MSFDYQIKADATQALGANKATEQSLKSVEFQAIRTSSVLFEGMRDANERMTAAGASAKGVTKELDLMAEGSKRAANAAKEIGGGTSVSGLAGMFGISLGAHELIHLADTYIEVSNKIRVVTANQGDFNHVMEESQAIAIRTRTGWDQTAATFQRLSAVTHDLGLTQKDVLRLTEEMAKASKISGASTFEARMAMSELSHAFEVGALTGREYKVLMRDTPQLMKELQVASGKSSQEFAEMGKHGKITADLLITWFGRADASISEKFGRTVPTLAERWQMFQDQVAGTIGKLENSFGVFEKVGGALGMIAENVAAAGKVLTFYKDAYGGIIDKISSTVGAGEGTSDKIVGYGKTLLSWVVNPLKAIGDISGFVGQQFQDKLIPAIGRATAQHEDLQHAIDLSAERINHMAELQGKAHELGFALKGVDISPDQMKRYDETRIKLKQLGVETEDAFGAARLEVKKLDGELEKLKEQDALKLQTEQAERLFRAANSINMVLRTQIKSHDELLDRQRDLKHLVEVGEGAQAQVDIHGAKAPILTDFGPKTMLEATTAMQRLTENRRALADVTQELHLRESGYTDATINAVKAANDEISTQKELKRALNESEISQDIYDKTVKKLHGALSEMEKIMQRLLKPQHDFELGTHALNVLLHEGRISTDLYRGEIKKLEDAYFGATDGGKEFLKMMRGLDDWKQHEHVNPSQGAKMSSNFGGGTPMLDVGGAPIFGTDVLGNATDEIVGYTAAEESAAEASHRLRMEADEAKASIDAREESASAELRASSKLLADNTARTKEWTKAIRELEQSHDALHGLQLGLSEVTKEIGNVAELSSKVATDAFHGLNDAIVNTANNGISSWSSFAATMSKLVDGILDDLARLALRFLELQLLNALLPGAGSIAGASGGSGLIHEAINSGGAHATGGSYVAGGSGGPDSQTVAFRMSPGERVDFTPKGGGGPQGGGDVTIINRVDDRELLRALGTPNGRRVIHNIVRTLPGAFGRTK